MNTARGLSSSSSALRRSARSRSARPRWLEMRVVWTALLLTCAACSAVDTAEEEDPDRYDDCRIDELPGSWRTEYRETSGSCGAIDDETSQGFSPGRDDDCVSVREDVSDDRCVFSATFRCPTSDGAGVQAWRIEVEQTSADELEGSGSVEITHPQLGACRSSYALTVTRR